MLLRSGSTRTPGHFLQSDLFQKRDLIDKCSIEFMQKISLVIAIEEWKRRIQRLKHALRIQKEQRITLSHEAIIDHFQVFGVQEITRLQRIG
jgi:hypothetical protein